ncbi:hypothetical protein K491DRAFT_656018 [Lophiostoma macrostomum CBS 122681]|uniref:Heterokaryon incompatibility domain-containing protein n=1 Tax=Lophiostoma macrostomum CBS 122681 TaxID=1314788 RepID=A0A6A6TA77_9PLEO|nr:hypothetical protein K491DRAFT_656018 [Lophiostoma macrostomum CBS 122681]
MCIESFATIDTIFPAKAFVPGAPRNWENLKVAQFVDSNTIRLALSIVGTPGDVDWCPAYKSLADLWGALLEAALALPLPDKFEHHQQYLHIQTARVFLWSTWNRCIILALWSLLRGHLDIGYVYNRTQSFVFEHTSLLRGFARHSNGGNSASVPSSEYMCRWAFRLLQSDLGSANLDFRHFHKRYHEVFREHKGRCMLNSKHPRATKQCSGVSPFRCNRFQGMKIEDHSAHSSTCCGDCTKLVWSESSYRGVSGPRAVDISTTQDGIIRYCLATHKTLAISHVWSHGQGGRPESPEPAASITLFKPPKGTGFNECLHKRYSQIAVALGCTSYWMDTPCIPQDHNLRRESISFINRIFADSLATLVCDRDIMSIEISTDSKPGSDGCRSKFNAANVAISVLESIASVLLVCDWNLRAWTFLEAMRGRRNLHLLCNHDKVVNLRDVIYQVHTRGRVDISVLLVNAQHLLPALRTTPEDATEGLVDVREASFLLSHRHASRKGDEVVIWSLLCGNIAYYTAIDFWTAYREPDMRLIPTSYLMTNLPRIRKGRGLGWAPARPNFPADWNVEARKRYFIVPTSNLCYNGHLDKDGFHSIWRFSEIQRSWFGGSLWRDREDNILRRQISLVIQNYLRWYTRGALLQPCDFFGQPIPYRGPADGHLLAVVGHVRGNNWRWKGIIDWPSTVPLPVFTHEWLVIV